MYKKRKKEIIVHNVLKTIIKKEKEKEKEKNDFYMLINQI